MPQTVFTASPEQIQSLILGQPGTVLSFWLAPPEEVTSGSGIQVDLMRGPTGGVGMGISRAELPHSVWPCASEAGPFIVRNLVPGGTAQQCGQIQIGDLLHSVNGVSVHNASFEEVNALVLGEPGLSVSLNLYSPPTQERSQILACASRLSAASRMSVPPETRLKTEPPPPPPALIVAKLTRGPSGAVGIDFRRWAT